MLHTCQLHPRANTEHIIIVLQPQRQIVMNMKRSSVHLSLALEHLPQRSEENQGFPRISIASGLVRLMDHDRIVRCRALIPGFLSKTVYAKKG